MSCRARTTVSCIAVSMLISCACGRSAGPSAEGVQRNVEAFQRALIARGVTGGSVAGVFRGADTVAFSIVNSGISGDMPISANTLFPLWSMSKAITVVAMMILHDRGAYSLDAPVARYIPYFTDMKCKDKTGTWYRCANELKVIHLLTHRSGYGYYDRGKGPSHLDPYEDLDRFVRDVAAHPAEFEPGTSFLYGLNMAVLGRLVEVLSGQELYAFLKDNIFDPLEMPNTKFELSADDRRRWQVLFKKPTHPVLPPGWFDEGPTTFSTVDDELTYKPGTKAQFGGEGLVGTFEDYRHFCEMLLGKGNYRGKRIVSERSISMMTSVTTPGRPIMGDSHGEDYGYSLWVLTEPILDGTGAPKGVYGWNGLHNTHFWIDNENALFGLFMTRTVPPSQEIGRQMRAAVYKGLK